MIIYKGRSPPEGGEVNVIHFIVCGTTSNDISLCRNGIHIRGISYG